jgi:hypothetical protein
MTISIGTSPGVPSLLQPLLQPNAADDGDAARPNEIVAGGFQSNPDIDPATDPAGRPTTTVSKKGGPLDHGTIDRLITLQSNSENDGRAQSSIFTKQDGRTVDSPVDRTDPRHLPAATPTHAHRHRHTLASDGVSMDSSSFAQNAVSSQTSTAADSASPSGAAATNVASNQNILLDQLIQLQKQLVTVANPILSTLI